MPHGHKVTHRPALEMPEGFDPSGVPCVDDAHPTPRSASPRRHHRPLPGLPAASMIATVEAVAEQGEREWLVWGSSAGRPVLFAVPSGRAAEMMATVAAGETATAIIEPWQLVLERLD